MSREIAFIVSDLYSFLPICFKLTETEDHNITIFLQGRAKTDLYPPFTYGFPKEQLNKVVELTNRNVKLSCEYPEKSSRKEIFELFERLPIQNITYEDFIVKSLNDGYEIIYM